MVNEDLTTEIEGSEDRLKVHAETLRLKNKLAYFWAPGSHISPDDPIGTTSSADAFKRSQVYP